MAQHDYIISNATFPAVRTDINNALSAIQTTNSGTSRPTGAVAGQLWLDTTSATTPTLKYYDGADDISLATIDHTANTVNWLDSTVSITGLSTTATGTVLTLSDSVNTTTVNLIIDNQKEIRFRETTANGTNYVALKAPASVSSDLTFTLPATDGASGQALVTNGSGVLSFASAGISWQSVQTTGFTAVAGRAYPCNTTSSAFTVTLPASPSVGDYIQIVDYAGTFATNNITLGANSNKINGVVGNKVLTTNREAVTITYVDSTQGWVSTSGSNEGTQSLDLAPYSTDYLVIAGGAGGGGDGAGAGGGGGGAGGYKSGTASLVLGTIYTITVGGAGTGGAGSGSAPFYGSAGTSGTNSSISGTGLTTITSTGGGAGGAFQTNSSGATGGSGGGGAGAGGFGASGSSPQGNSGGDGYADAPFSAGGGGGSSASGVSATSSSTGGNGGNGTASSITGSSVTRAGGGGGGGGQGGSNGTDGTGGGSTANLGGGGTGGQGGSPYAGGSNGGSGVVILRMLTADYSGTTTGSPTVTTDGSYKVIVFNSSGTYTG
jgi:hypothetical protein